MLSFILLFIVCIAAIWYWKQYTQPGPLYDRQAQQDAAEGKLTGAEQKWLQGIREDPVYAPCYIHLGDLYMQARRFPEAVTEYQAAAALTPNDGALFLEWNRADLAVHDLKGAEATAKRAAELLPEDADAAGLYGLFEAQQKNDAAALAPLRRAHQLRPSDRDYLLELVRIEVENAAFAQAQNDLAPYLETHPTDFWACHMMGVVFEMKAHTPADSKLALMYEQRAQAGLPTDPRVYMTLGDLYLDLGRPADALQAFQTGQKLLPNSEAMWNGLMRSYSQLGDKKQAMKSAAGLKQVVSRHQEIVYLSGQREARPADVLSGLTLARLKEEDGDNAGAFSLLTILLRQVPHDPHLHRALAGFYLRHGRPTLAAKALRIDFIP